jgi:hypothetical protein
MKLMIRLALQFEVKPSPYVENGIRHTIDRIELASETITNIFTGQPGQFGGQSGRHYANHGAAATAASGACLHDMPYR